MIVECELVFGWAELTSWKYGRVKASPRILGCSGICCAYINRNHELPLKHCFMRRTEHVEGR